MNLVWTTVLLLFFGMPLMLWGQNGVVSGFAESSGSGGTVSGSFAQVFYTFPASAEGSLSEGLQQAYVAEDIGIREGGATSFLFIYPNPTRGVVQLDLPDLGAPWRIDVIDLSGRLLGRYPHPTGRSQWTLPPLASGGYVFRFFAGKELITTSTIFKHH